MTTEQTQDHRVQQMERLNLAKTELLTTLKNSFVENVVNKDNGVNKYAILMDFAYKDQHKTDNEFTKLIFEKTSVIKDFQTWLNVNYPTIVNDKNCQQYFCRFYSYGKHYTQDERFSFNVNWDYRTWKNHSPLETGKHFKHQRRPYNKRQRHQARDEDDQVQDDQVQDVVVEVVVVEEQ